MLVRSGLRRRPSSRPSSTCNALSSFFRTNQQMASTSAPAQEPEVANQEQDWGRGLCFPFDGSATGARWDSRRPAGTRWADLCCFLPIYSLDRRRYRLVRSSCLVTFRPRQKSRSCRNAETDSTSAVLLSRLAPTRLRLLDSCLHPLPLGPTSAAKARLSKEDLGRSL